MHVSWSIRIAAMAAAVSCLAILRITAAHAHPHVWVTVKTELLFDARKQLTGFRHQWTFDEAYSAFAVEGSDANQDGAYDREELKALAEVNISSLKEFDYFTFPRNAGQALARVAPKDYWLEYHDKKLTLFFTLPLAKPLPISEAKGFSFAIYDPTNYVDFGLAKQNPVKLIDAPTGCVPEVSDPASRSTSGSLLNMPPPSDDPAAQYASIVRIQCPGS